MTATPAEIIIAFFILFGATFVLVGAIGLFRLPDIFMRLHAPTKASTLGVGSVLVASAIYFSYFSVEGGPGVSLHEILISIFLFITAPITGHLIAKAAMRLRVSHTSSGVIPEEQSRPTATPDA